eukprot:PLAT558.1.p2 GENE.PLAT558.1~~PLAT558.1.p2  ORF type:complete len:350 (-),score=190.05 PLAT558.1:74-1123(-)
MASMWVFFGIEIAQHLQHPDVRAKCRMGHRHLTSIFTGCIAALTIGAARVYTGAHFLSQVGTGWLFGGVVLFSFLLLERYVREPYYIHFMVAGGCRRAIKIILLSLPLVTLCMVPYAMVANYKLPSEWAQTHLAQCPDNPIRPQETVDLCFAAVGIILACVSAPASLLWRKLRFDAARGTVFHRFARAVVGVAFAAVPYFLLGLISKDSGAGVTMIFRSLLRFYLTALAILHYAPAFTARYAFLYPPPPPLRTKELIEINWDSSDDDEEAAADVVASRAPSAVAAAAAAAAASDASDDAGDDAGDAEREAAVDGDAPAPLTAISGKPAFTRPKLLSHGSKRALDILSVG